MAKIDAKMVKELRERTGAGMMDCKKALTETDGDMEKAIDYLREKGIAKAEKKAGRIASEGVVAAYVADDAKVAALVEINCETDFVAVTEKFHVLCDKIAKHIAETNPADLDALNASTLEGKTVAEIVTEAVASIGEKISLRRFERYENASGRIASYIHMGGKIGVLVDLSGGTAEIGKDVAMHIAASAPTAIDRSGVKAEALEEGKPEKIVERMVEGRINKFYQEVCLLEQPFVKDPDKKVQEVLGDVKVERFVRFELGEGLEKKSEDFAAEVAAQIKG